MIANKFMLYFLIIIVYYLQLSVSTGNGELQFVQILFRHGDRSPIRLYPTDPNPESFWKEGLGKLTLLGRRQHYVLGKYLRNMYDNFITTSPLEISIQSSEVDRCIKSAECNIATFFAPKSPWKFEDNVNWQPLPIFYVPEDEDRYLETGSYCPTAFEEENRVANSPSGQKFNDKHKTLYELLSAYSGVTVTNWTSASYLFDSLFIEKKYNLSIPHWAAENWDELDFIKDMSFFLSFNSTLLHRLRAGPLIGKMIEKMKQKISGELAEQKIQIYSGHDTNIAVFMDALNIFNMKQPPYCATILMELYETESNHSIRILYLNSTHPESDVQSPHVLILPNCTEYCPLDFFISYTQHLIPKNWDEECKKSSLFFTSLNGLGLSVTIGVTLTVVLIILASCFAYWRLQHRRKEKYSYQCLMTSSAS